MSTSQARKSMSLRVKSGIFSRSQIENVFQQSANQQQELEKEKQVVPQDPTFGVALATLLAREDHANSNVRIPNIVRHCVSSLYKSTWINGSGLYTDGIFRESGNNNKVQEFKKLYDNKEIVNFSNSQAHENPFDMVDPHTTASILRLYLRELPEPIMGYGSYDPVLNALRNQATMPHMTLKILKECVQNNLDRTQKTMVNTLLFLLKETARLNDKMKESNLGIVFGQVFFREPPVDPNAPKETTGNAMLDMANKMKEAQLFNTAVEIMIQNYYQFFTGKEDCLHKVYDPYLTDLAIQYTIDPDEPEQEVLNPLFGVELVFPEEYQEIAPKHCEERPLEDVPQSFEKVTSRPIHPVAKLIKALNIRRSISTVEPMMTHTSPKESSTVEPMMTYTSPKEPSQPLDDTKEFYANENQVNSTMNEFERIIKDCPDEATKKKLEDLYARVFYSVYVVIPNTGTVTPYSVLLERRRAEYEKRKMELDKKEEKIRTALTTALNNL